MKSKDQRMRSGPDMHREGNGVEKKVVIKEICTDDGYASYLNVDGQRIPRQEAVRDS